MEETIRDSLGRIIGYIETDSLGNKTAKKFAGPFVGKYDASLDVTKDMYGRIVAKGDCVVALLWQE